MSDGCPNPNIWGNIITCVEIGINIYEIVGDKQQGLSIPEQTANRLLPNEVIETAVKDGNDMCFTDEAALAVVADELLKNDLVTDQQAVTKLDLLRQPDTEIDIEPEDEAEDENER